jgi:hypothetical protein
LEEALDLFLKNDLVVCCVITFKISDYIESVGIVLVKRKHVTLYGRLNQGNLGPVGNGNG